jgi:hypothetical protein
MRFPPVNRIVQLISLGVPLLLASAPRVAGANHPALLRVPYSGPEWTPGPPALMIEDFTGGPPLLTNYGKARFSSEIRTSSSPGGSQEINFTLEPTGLRGGHGLDIGIKIPAEKADWRGYDGVELWAYLPEDSAFAREVCHGGLRQRIEVVTVTADPNDQRSFRADTVPTPEKWQRVVIPFNVGAEILFPSWPGRWESKSEPGRRKWSRDSWNHVKEIHLRISAHKDQPNKLAIAGLGLFRNPPPNSPRVVLQPDSDAGFVFTTGSEFAIRAEASNLPPGKTASIRIQLADFDGRSVYDAKMPIPTEAGQTFKVSFRMPNNTSGWFEASAILELDGETVFRSSRGLASLPALAEAQDAARRSSVFAIWPNVHPALGAGMVRKPVQPWTDRPDWHPARLPSQSVSGLGWVIGAPWEKGKWFEPNAEGYKAWSERLTKAVQQLAAEKRWPYYSTINEPNAHYWGPMEKVVEFHRVVYEAIKRGDPDARVGGPCPYDIDVAYLEKFVEAGGAQWIDFFDVHGYSANEQQFIEKLDSLNAFLRGRGLEKKEVLITEMGYSVPSVTPRQQAALLARTYVAGLSRNVKVINWHGLFKNPGSPEPRPIKNQYSDYEIVRTDGSPNPAFVAYGAMTRMLLTAVFDSPIQGLPQGCCGFAFKKEGRRLRVLWSHDGRSHNADIPVRGNASVTDLMGVSRPMDAQEGQTVQLTLTECPLYLVD